MSAEDAALFVDAVACGNFLDNSVLNVKCKTNRTVIWNML